PKSNWLAMWIFLAAIAVVALLGADSDLRPTFGGKPLSMVLVIIFEFIFVVLRVVTNTRVFRPFNGAVIGVQIANQRLQQRRFTH
ncbi:hypothetical protein MJI20_30025, partial [Salmonella enterica subsp. enterica serovar Anatum]|nr:hypothetical protein [Salmonella enterica subsp. enterica serovar Anatum]